MTGGLALGAPMAGFAIDHRGWQAGFLVVAVIGLLVALAGACGHLGSGHPAQGGSPTERRPPTPDRGDGECCPWPPPTRGIACSPLEIGATGALWTTSGACGRTGFVTSPTRFKAQAQRLDEASADVQQAVATLRPVWTGPDASSFQRRAAVLVHEVDRAATGVRALAAELFAELQAQVETSAVSDGHGGGPAGPLADTASRTATTSRSTRTCPLRPLDLLWQLFGEDSPWTPQGLAVDAGGGLLMTTMYNAHDTTDGLLVIQDAATGEVLNTVRLDGIDHYGGVAVHGDNVWVSGARTGPALLALRDPGRRQRHHGGGARQLRRSTATAPSPTTTASCGPPSSTARAPTGSTATTSAMTAASPPRPAR